MPSGRRSSSGRATACPPIRAPGWSRPAASRRSTACAGARASTPLDDVGERGGHRGRRCGGVGGSRERRRRPAAADLHLLPPGAVARRAGGADAARGLRPDDRGDRAGVPHARADAGPAHRARQGEDPRRAHSLPGADAGRAAGAARRRAARDLPRLQRGLRRVVGRVADAARSVRRGDPPGAAARRAAAGAGGARPARADAAARVAARGAHVAVGRTDPARRSGPLAVEPRADRRRRAAGGAGAGVAPVRPVHDSGGDRRGPRRGADRRRDRLGARSSASTTCCARRDPSPVIELNRAVAVAMRDGPAAGLALIDAILARGDLLRLPPGARRAGRPVPPARAERPTRAPRTSGRWR